jgi:hypothetical protein
MSLALFEPLDHLHRAGASCCRRRHHRYHERGHRLALSKSRCLCRQSNHRRGHAPDHEGWRAPTRPAHERVRGHSGKNGSTYWRSPATGSFANEGLVGQLCCICSRPLMAHLIRSLRCGDRVRLQGYFCRAGDAPGRRPIDPLAFDRHTDDEDQALDNILLLANDRIYEPCLQSTI